MARTAEQLTAHIDPATTDTAGRVYRQFRSYGRGYDTLAAVAIRLAQLAHDDTPCGISDGRESERQQLLADLAQFARERGAKYPHATIRMAFENIALIYNFTEAPILSVREEIGIAAHNTNLRVLQGRITPSKGDQ